LTEALELARQEPGRAYEAVVDGARVELRVVPEPTPAQPTDDSTELDGPPYLTLDVEFPWEPVTTVTATWAESPWLPDPFVIPKDDEGVS
jgi:hypothetical protein